MTAAPAVHIKRWTRREYDRMAEADLFDPDERGELLEGDIHDHPRTAVLVIEVADSTIAKDRTYKTRIYAHAGIREYWIVNLAERCLEVYRDSVTAPGDAGTYRSSQKLSPSDSIAAPRLPWIHHSRCRLAPVRSDYRLAGQLRSFFARLTVRVGSMQRAAILA